MCVRNSVCALAVAKGWGEQYLLEDHCMALVIVEHMYIDSNVDWSLSSVKGEGGSPSLEQIPFCRLIFVLRCRSRAYFV